MPAVRLFDFEIRLGDMCENIVNVVVDTAIF